MDNPYLNTAKNNLNYEDESREGTEYDSQVLSHLIRKSLEKKFGVRGAASIINTGCSNLGESENKILSNYVLFSKMIEKIFGKFGKEEILDFVEEDLKKQGML